MTTTKTKTAAEKAAEHEADANDAIAEANAEQAEPEPVVSDEGLAGVLDHLADGLTKGDRQSADAMHEAARRLRAR